LVELVENRDYAGSSHFFFDLGNRNLLGFFDFPGHDHPDFSETIGAVQHIALSQTPEAFAAMRRRLDEAGISYIGPTAGSTTASTSATQRRRPGVLRGGARPVRGRAAADLNPPVPVVELPGAPGVLTGEGRRVS
jgi:hypothetical protein